MTIRLIAFYCMLPLLLGRWTSDCDAQFKLPSTLSKMQVELPQPNATGATPRGSGFDATIQLTNLIGAGYCNVVAELKSTIGPSATSRTLAVRLTPIDRHVPAVRTIASEIPFTFPQGQSKVTVERAFPKWTIGNSYRIEILEDGVVLPNYSAEVGNALPGYAIRTPTEVLRNEEINNIALIDVQPTTIAMPPNVNFISRNNSHVSQTMTFASLPSDWRVLREVDCIVVDQDQLTASGKTGVIRDWVMMGGTLVVLGSTDASRLGQAMQFTLVAASPENDSMQTFVRRRFGQAIQRNQRLQTWLRTTIQGPLNPVVRTMQGSQIGVTAKSIDIMDTQEGIYDNSVRPTRQQVTDIQNWLQRCEVGAKRFESVWKQGERSFVGAGQIIGLPAKTIDSEQSFFVLDDLTTFQKSPMLQRGVDPIMGDTRTRRWLIPGVAEPPVYTFMGILTLFVLLVGPIAYRWTTRGHRSHLMFLIAPALALVTTAAMFSYSIVSDGFGTKVRVRQITWIDGASGDAAERTRSTLFSGISPRDGLQFSGDAEVMTYPNGGQVTWDELRSDVDEVRMIATIDDDVQQFGPSAIPSRTQTQFVSHRIRRGIGGLKISGLKSLDASETTPTTDAIQISNTLSFDVRDVVVCSQDGRYWQTGSIKAGESSSAKLIPKLQDASKLLGDLYTLYRPVGSVSRSGRTRRNEKVGDLILYMNRQISRGGAVATDGVFEDSLNEMLFVQGEIPPGSYVAVSNPSEDVIAVKNAEQVESVRYVMGTLQ